MGIVHLKIDDVYSIQLNQCKFAEDRYIFCFEFEPGHRCFALLRCKNMEED